MKQVIILGVLVMVLMASGALADVDLWQYDTNGNNVIDKSEAMDAIVDYFDNKITKDEALQVIVLYFDQTVNAPDVETVPVMFVVTSNGMSSDLGMIRVDGVDYHDCNIVDLPVGVPLSIEAVPVDGAACNYVAVNGFYYNSGTITLSSDGAACQITIDKRGYLISASFTPYMT